AALGKRQALELEFARLLRNVAEKFGKSRRLQIEVDEDELLPGFAAQRDHAHGGAIEKFHAVDFGRADQTAIERVSPAVIGAVQNLLATRALGDGSRAVTADIAEGAQRPRLVACDDPGFAGYIECEICFRVSNRALHSLQSAAALGQRANELPGAEEDALLLKAEHRRIGVVARRERFRAFQLRINVQTERFAHHGRKLSIQAEKFKARHASGRLELAGFLARPAFDDDLGVGVKLHRVLALRV